MVSFERIIKKDERSSTNSLISLKVFPSEMFFVNSKERIKMNPFNQYKKFHNEIIKSYQKSGFAKEEAAELSYNMRIKLEL